MIDLCYYSNYVEQQLVREGKTTFFHNIKPTFKRFYIKNLLNKLVTSAVK